MTLDEQLLALYQNDEEFRKLVERVKGKIARQRVRPWERSAHHKRHSHGCDFYKGGSCCCF